MELRTFAEQILFGDRLEDKLVAPDRFTDTLTSVAPIAVPRFPGRPVELSLGRGQADVFPTPAEMEHEEHRARVFHFFANHELMALELMALALLRFPDAPAQWRLGIAQIMREEQKHLLLYRERLEALGLKLGDVAVNDFFWRNLSGISSPLEFIAGLSLTFEQANLDFSLHYRDVFAAMGDTPSRDVMEIVFREEIGHVRHGVMWLEKTKTRGESQWDAYRRLLKYPLTPSRGKGLRFALEARQLAGLDQQFIDEMVFYPEAKTRPARILWYNPDCEAELAAGNGYRPPQEHKLLMHDFAMLPLFLAKEGDVVVTHKTPSRAFREQCVELGLARPYWLETADVREPDWTRVPEVRVQEFTPWGWSAKARQHALTLQATYAATYNGFIPEAALLRKIFSKHELPAIRKSFRDANLQHIPLLGDEAALGVLCASVDAVLELHQRVSSESQRPIVVKVPYSAAGQGTIRLRVGEEPSASQLGWLAKMIKHYGQVMVEPWYERTIDVSFQFNIQDKAELLGPTRFYTDQRGQYGGHWLGPLFKDIDQEDQKRLYRPRSQGESLMSIAERGARHAAAWLHQQGFRGLCGVDAFFYQDPLQPDAWRAQVIGEINPRHTMGHVTLSLQRLIHKGQPGVWVTLAKPTLRDFGYQNFKQMAADLQAKHPMEYFFSTRRESVKSGIFFTNDPEQAEACLGVVAVGDAACAEIQRLAARLEMKTKRV